VYLALSSESTLERRDRTDGARTWTLRTINSDLTGTATLTLLAPILINRVKVKAGYLLE
jgi:hypothetical protein